MSKMLRYVVAGIIICLVFAFYIVSMKNYSKENFGKNEIKRELESKIIVSPEDVLKDDYFYSNGDAVYDININNKIITIIPHEDIFVTLSRKLKLDGDKLEKIELDFEYLYEFSGNNNPHKDAGGVVILLSKNGYRSLDSTSVTCKMESKNWQKCHYIINNPGNPIAAILRLGATSYYRKVAFKNISLTTFK